MRFLVSGFTALFLVSCTPDLPPTLPSPHPERPIATPADTPKVEKIVTQPVAASVPKAPVQPARFVRNHADGITYEGVSYDSRSHRLAVIDQAGGPGSQFADAASAGTSHGALAAVNAGFFTPEGKPLGLVVADGKISGAWNLSSLGSGIWMQQASGNQSIVRRENVGKSAARSQHELLQAGPMLIENSRPVAGLENAKTTLRTLILWDGGTRWWIGQTSACTLVELSDNLSHASPAGWKPRHALNLDGGRSSDLWVSGSITGGPITKRSSWNRPVRNFLILLPR